jgi:hypothetical protein
MRRDDLFHELYSENHGFTRPCWNICVAPGGHGPICLHFQYLMLASSALTHRTTPIALTDLASGTIKVCLPSVIGYPRGSADLLTARDQRCFSLQRTAGPGVQSCDQPTNSQRPLSLKPNYGLASTSALLRFSAHVVQSRIHDTSCD